MNLTGFADWLSSTLGGTVRTSLVLGICLLLGTSCAMNTDEDFEVGQEWGYQTRPQEPNSSIVIGDIEDHPDKGTIIHISVVGVRVQNPRAEGGYFTEIGHIPVSQDSLQSSVTELLGSGVQIDGVAEGISTWREAEGGVFTISVAEAVQCIEDSLVGGAISEE